MPVFSDSEENRTGKNAYSTSALRNSAKSCATIEFSMKIALGQINTTVGDLTGNVERMVSMAHEASAQGADVAVFPELSITGYPPRDLVEKPTFIERSERAIEQLAEAAKDLPISIIAGYVGRSHNPTGIQATNSAAV